jgi:bleomycin hydrolase
MILAAVIFSIIVSVIDLSAEEKFLRRDSTTLEFIVEKTIKHTPVQSQDSTGTCWVFATLSFLESEIMRMNREEIDLSEMFVVRHLYPEKAMNYFRLHGRSTFGEGGLSHDVLASIKKYGMVPESIYPGNKDPEGIHSHSEMISILKAMLDAVISEKNEYRTSLWENALLAVLDIYLGQPPEEFIYKNKLYFPLTFSQYYLDLDFSDYLELTSFSHHPYYQKFRLEVPDNWSYCDDYFNLTLDELEAVVDFALQNGYSVVWDGDVGDDSYADKKTGYATVPLDGSDRAAPEEKEISAEMRQENFDNFETTDDHLMHLVGAAHDQHGRKFYLMKDSWYANTPYRGYIYLSRSYFRLKTVAIMVHKDGIPEKIRKKIDL